MVRFHPGSFGNWSVGVSAARLLGKEEGRVQVPDGPSAEHGCQGGSPAQGESGSERREPTTRAAGPPMVTTPGLQPGNRGSIHRRSTEQHGLMVQRDDIRPAV